MDDCKHDWSCVFREEGEQGRYKTVEVCTKCGTFYVDIVGDVQFFEFEFKLNTLVQLAAVAEPILAKYGLRIVSAREVDRSTAQRQALEDFLSEE